MNIRVVHSGMEIASQRFFDLTPDRSALRPPYACLSLCPSQMLSNPANSTGATSIANVKIKGFTPATSTKRNVYAGPYGFTPVHPYISPLATRVEPGNLQPPVAPKSDVGGSTLQPATPFTTPRFPNHSEPFRTNRNQSEPEHRTRLLPLPTAISYLPFSVSVNPSNLDQSGPIPTTKSTRSCPGSS